MTQTMVPISGRIEDCLYEWFVGLEYPGAKTNSDKLREALKELKRQHDAAGDFVAAQAWMQAQTQPLRQALAVLERDALAHSEVLAGLVEHVSAMAATLISAQPATIDEAAQAEEQLVRRAMLMTEALLRHALTPSAAAFDPEVVRRHSVRTVELAGLIHTTSKGEGNG